MKIFINDGDAIRPIWENFKEATQSFESLSFVEGELWAETDKNGRVTIVFVGEFADDDEWENLTGEIQFKTDIVAVDEDSIYNSVYCYERVIDISNTLELV